MASRTLYQLTVNLPSPEELYNKHQEKITAAPDGTLVLQELVLRNLQEICNKLRLRNLAEVPLGSSNIQHELTEVVRALLLRIRRHEEDPNTRLAFAMANDPGRHQRQVVFDLSQRRARLKVDGVPPKNGIPGFLREKGRYAAERQARQRSQRMDHYTTGEFAQAAENEVLAVIDNSRINGEAGIDVRGIIIKPKTAAPFNLELGPGVEKREITPGKFKLLATLSGVVRTRYDGDHNLRYLAVERDLRLDEVGFRAGGHVKARSTGNRNHALELDEAEFRTIPTAFEARTEGRIRVKELIQGKVYGARVEAEMVNQGEGKYIVATNGPITINRSLQKGFLYAPEIIIGNGRLTATLMNAQLHARNRFTGHKILLAGNNRLVLGNDLMREQETTGKADSCLLSGRDLFRGRDRLLRELADNRQQLQAGGEKCNELLADHIRNKANGRLPDRTGAQRTLAAITNLQQELLDCPAEAEEDLRRRLTHTLFDLGLENVLPLLKLLGRQKELKRALVDQETKLAEMTQPIEANLDLEGCKEGATLWLECWHDQLLLQKDSEIIIKRPDDNQELARLPNTGHHLTLTFNYETAKLELTTAKSPPG